MKPASVIAIDPGTTHSGIVWYENGKVVDSGVLINDDVRGVLIEEQKGFVAIEMIASYGMAVGKEVFETCLWIGRFKECAYDANIRQAIIDRYGGKAEAIGTVKKQGPLYGVKSHAWAALAVAITATET